jgi:hypothetical protein
MNRGKGENHPKAKPKARDIPTNREQTRQRRWGIVARKAREHGVDWSTIRDIRDGKIWLSVPE